MSKSIKRIIPLLCILSLMFFTVNAQDDFKIIKKRVVNELMKADVNDAEVTKLLVTIREDGTWPGINYENVSRTGFEHRFHLSNMLVLARAYKNKESKLYKQKRIKKTIELALKNWVDNDYICENWWHNQVGTTNSLVTLLLIIGNDLDGDLVEKTQPIIGRAHTEAGGARPGGDRIKIAGIQAKNLLFIGDAQNFDKVVRIIENEIKFTEWIGNDFGYGHKKILGGFSNRSAEGRGIQYDYSFHHRTDGVNNTLSYGLGYANAFVEWATYTNGTQFSFSEEKLAVLIDYYLDGICKTAVFGKFPDAGAKNRSISRKGTLKPYNSDIPEKLLLVSDYRKDELQEIVEIRNNGISPTLSHATNYWDSDHFTFQRPKFFTSVRMYSTRLHNMEWPYNREGLFNHHRGDGANHISVTGDEYFDIWPVYDYQKIPGTTVMQKDNLPNENEVQKHGLTNFVGAASDGKYAAVAFDFKSPHDPLIARKSWFFFDDEYVCLGSGISCKKEMPVATTLNQCLLRGDVTISTDGEKSIIVKNENEYGNVDWVLHDGIGYVFPKPTSIHVLNSGVTGSWWRINKQSNSPKDEVKLDVFKLWIDHGKRPSDDTYEYIIVPATSLVELEQNISKNNIDIISNTPEIQAVINKNLRIIQSVFYKSGEITYNGLKVISDAPGIVILEMKGEELGQITVADPTKELAKIHLSISIKIESERKNFRAVWNEKEKFTEITINLPKDSYAGDSVTIEL